MTTPTIHGAEHDLAVIREVRDLILAGDWGKGASRLKRCLVDHFHYLGADAFSLLAPEIPHGDIGTWNDTHTQAEVVALLDDVEDSLLGELGVL